MKSKYLVGISTIAIIGLVALSMNLGGGTSKRNTSMLPWKSFDEAANLAQKEQKKIIVDVYTTWCGWCKKMDSEVYSDEAVVATLNAYFIPVKLNAEASKPLTYEGQKMTETEFAKAMGISGYPTTVFFEPNGKPITIVPGFIHAEEFVRILMYIGENHYKSTSYEDYCSSTRKMN